MGIAIDLKRRAPHPPRPSNSTTWKKLGHISTSTVPARKRCWKQPVFFTYDFLTCLFPQIPAERSVDEIFADVCAALDKL